MNKILISAAIILGVGFSACSSWSNSNSQTQKEEKIEISNKKKVVALLKSIETGEQEPLGYINPNKYIQHNLGVPDGFAGFREMLQQLSPNLARINTVRAFQDGDYVFTHTEYNFSDSKIGFDIFRFEDGKIVEHWDNLQEMPTSSNPSGHTMIDGTTEIKDLDKTEANKTLVRNFVEDILINGKLEKIAGYFDGDNYIQHNPQISDQLSGLIAALEASGKEGAFKYDKIHKVLDEGNFVLVVGEGHSGKDHTALYDLFRVENGKIAEHWDVIEPIPARENWKNNNGKF